MVDISRTIDTKRGHHGDRGGVGRERGRGGAADALAKEEVGEEEEPELSSRGGQFEQHFQHGVLPV